MPEYEKKIYNPTDDDIVYFAKTDFRNREKVFGIRRDDRRRHMYVLGKTGTGKSTMLENLALSDIQNGEGIAFFDPHGESVERLLNYIPPERINDVVYINPQDTDYPIGFNVLEIKNEKQKHLVASGLMAVFTKLWANVWSARMEYILNNTVLALLDTPGQTLLGIPRMYADKKYRAKVVANIKDPVVKNFWETEYANWQPGFASEAVSPIQNKVGQFLSSSIMRNIVSQPKSTIDFRDIMDKRQIMIVNLSKGRIGEDSSALLGAMMITKLQLAAMSRVDIPESERTDFYLYVDEFQNFATESFATILSEARKYKLNLIVAHQYIGQLYDAKTRSAPVRDAIFGNVGTMIIFRTGADDAEFLEKEFEPVFDLNDLVNLSKFHIYLKLMINGVSSTPFSAMTLSPIGGPTDSQEKVIKVSRERYALKKEEIERKIFKWLDLEYVDSESKSSDVDSDDEVEVSVPEVKPKQVPQINNTNQQKNNRDRFNRNSKPQETRQNFSNNTKVVEKPVENKAKENTNLPKPTKPAKQDDIWDQVIEEQHKALTSQDIMTHLLSAIENTPLKATEIKTEKEVVKEEPKPVAEKAESLIQTPIEKNEDTKKQENNHKLKPGERVQFS